MILGIGIDLVQISVYRNEVLNPNKEAYLASHFSPQEIKLVEARDIEDKAELYAARWAAKEAFVKAINGPDLKKEELWTDWPDAREIQILSDIRERPYLEALGKVKKILLDRAVNKVHVSLSHSGDYATAMVILES